MMWKMLTWGHYAGLSAIMIMIIQKALKYVAMPVMYCKYP